MSPPQEEYIEMDCSGQTVYEDHVFHIIIYGLEQGCQTHFHWGPRQPPRCLQRAECNFNSLTVKEYLSLYSPKIFSPLKATARLM